MTNEQEHKIGFLLSTTDLTRDKAIERLTAQDWNGYEASRIRQAEMLEEKLKRMGLPYKNQNG